MATGKRIKFYRERLKWTLHDLSEVSNVDVGTISALENRDSDRSKFFPAIAWAFGLSVDQMADASTDYFTQPPRTPGQGFVVMEGNSIYQVDRKQDAWLAEGNRILASLSPEDRRAAVLSLRLFVQNLGPPRDGQALSVAG